MKHQVFCFSIHDVDTVAFCQSVFVLNVINKNMTSVTQISIENQYYEICKQVNNNMCHSFTDRDIGLLRYIIWTESKNSQ